MMQNFGSEPYLIEIGNNVKIVNGVRFITHDGGVHVLRNSKEKYRNIDLFGRIIIKDNVFIGLNSIILPGVTIGTNVVIGAGSIVTRSIPDNTIVAGNPARKICTINEFEIKRKNLFLNSKQLDFNEKKSKVLNEKNRYINRQEKKA